MCVAESGVCDPTPFFPKTIDHPKRAKKKTGPTCQTTAGENNNATPERVRARRAGPRHGGCAFRARLNAARTRAYRATDHVASASRRRVVSEALAAEPRDAGRSLPSGQISLTKARCLGVGLGVVDCRRAASCHGAATLRWSRLGRAASGRSLGLAGTGRRNGGGRRRSRYGSGGRARGTAAARAPK